MTGKMPAVLCTFASALALSLVPMQNVGSQQVFPVLHQQLPRNRQQTSSRSDMMLLAAALSHGTPITLANFSSIANPDIGQVIGEILSQLNATAGQVRQPILQFNQPNRNLVVATPTRVVSNQFRGRTTRRPPSATSPSTRRSNIRRLPSIPGRIRNSQEGKLRLVGGQTLFEGNVEINHRGSDGVPRWGSICDDDWDLAEANVVCREMGFVLGAFRATTDSHFGKSRRLIWMNNLFCAGFEKTIQECPFSGWKKHDCSQNEAAGVICRTQNDQQEGGSNGNSILFSKLARSTAKPNSAPKHSTNVRLITLFGDDIKVRLADEQGRVELRINEQRYVVCGDGWALNEAQVVCKQLGMGFAENVLHLELLDEEPLPSILSGISCNGNESRIAQCSMSDSNEICPEAYENIAGVACAPELPDLMPDTFALESSAFIEDRSILFLQCAMEENCLSRSAYELDKSDPNWIYETRRLLRFTASISNVGKVDFRPFSPKHQWIWHSCHRHYHSMEIFAHFDLLDQAGIRVAEGHKASFCLEDNQCQEGSRAKYACANYGDQGISVGCVDTYKYDLDCQWIDITDIPPGEYNLKLTINPEMKVPEMTFDNNAALCRFFYTPVGGYVTNCRLVRP